MKNKTSLFTKGYKDHRPLFTKGYKDHRPLFTDGINSFWHVVFGMISYYCIFIIPLFVLYQLKDIHDVNLFVDLAEFFIGLVLVIILHNIYIK